MGSPHVGVSFGGHRSAQRHVDRAADGPLEDRAQAAQQLHPIRRIKGEAGTLRREVIATPENVAVLSATFSGVAMTSRLERTGPAFDAPDRVKLLRGAAARVRGVDWRRGERTGQRDSMEPQTEPTWSDPVPFTMGETIQADTFAAVVSRAAADHDTAINWRIKKVLIDAQGGW